MLDQLPVTLPAIAVGAIVFVVGIARINATDRWWAPDAAWFWWPLRRFAWPPLDIALAALSTRLPLELYAKTQTGEDELVAYDVDITLDELHDDLANAGYEAQPLASLARFDLDSNLVWIDGEYERSSLARYYGSKPLGIEWLPDWLRKRQVHVRPYGPDGSIAPTAHAEYNPWRPDLALHHLLGRGLDVDEGVRKAAEDLGLTGGNDAP